MTAIASPDDLEPLRQVAAQPGRHRVVVEIFRDSHGLSANLAIETRRHLDHFIPIVPVRRLRLVEADSPIARAVAELWRTAERPEA